MSTITTAVALLAIGALIVWTLGSVLLRSLGFLTAAAGLLLAATGTPAGLAIAVIGALGWLGGHALYAVLSTPTAPRSPAASTPKHR